MIPSHVLLSPSTRWRAPGRIVLAYTALYLLFDWVSYIRPLEGFNITPWNPQPALAVALLMWNPRWLWLVWLALLATEGVVRGATLDAVTLIATTTAISLSYALTARVLALRRGGGFALDGRGDLVWIGAVTCVGGLLDGLAYVGALMLCGHDTANSVPAAVVRYWIGDTVGLLVTLPLILILLAPPQRRALAATLRSPQWWLIAAIGTLLLAVVLTRGEGDQFRFFYLLLLPVIWASAQFGIAGAVLAAGITQLGLIAGLQLADHSDLTVFELQVLMAVVTLTALLLGVVVDARARATAALRGSLHLAAAGQMSAALAHELNQPLTALNSYAESCELLLAQPGIADHVRAAQLADVVRRMVADARRASTVVKHLRDFFGSGATALRAVAPARLLEDAIADQARQAAARRIAIDLDAPATLPPIAVDAVQVGVVLRNLLSNALDAAAQGKAPGRVRVRASVESDTLRIDVEDSGDGIHPARLPALFEPGASHKPGGMGIGLSICRAIVEAHGGRLWAEPGPGGHFCLTLPLDLELATETFDAS